MQVKKKVKFLHRLYSYGASLYLSQLKKGKKPEPKVVVIAFTCFTYVEGETFLTGNSLLWKGFETQGYFDVGEFPLQYIIIQLPQFLKDLNNEEKLQEVEDSILFQWLLIICRKKINRDIKDILTEFKTIPEEIQSCLDFIDTYEGCEEHEMNDNELNNQIKKLREEISQLKKIIEELREHIEDSASDSKELVSGSV